MNGETKTKNPERKDEPNEHSDWDNLAKLAESETWEEHLKNANDFIKKLRNSFPMNYGLF